MQDVWVADPGLAMLAQQARRLAVDVERSQVEAEAVVRHDVGGADGAHRALAGRWFAGLRCAEAAATQLADEIVRCGREPGDGPVTFVGLHR